MTVKKAQLLCKEEVEVERGHIFRHYTLLPLLTAAVVLPLYYLSIYTYRTMWRLKQRANENVDAHGSETGETHRHVMRQNIKKRPLNGLGALQESHKQRAAAPPRVASWTEYMQECYDAVPAPPTWGLTAAAAASILHAPGLTCQARYNDNNLVTLAALLGAVTEGICYLIILTRMGLHTARQARQMRQRKAETSTAFSSHIGVLQTMVSGLATMALAVSIFLALLGDYVYQFMSAGNVPDMWIVLSGLRELSNRLWVHGARETGKTATVLLMVMTSCVTGLALFVHAIRTELQRQPEHNNASTAVSLRTTTLAPHFWLYNNRLVCHLSILSIVLYATGVWAPILHLHASVMGGMVFLPPGSAMMGRLSQRSARTSMWPSLLRVDQQRQRPNVVFLIHESLSGTAMLYTNEGRNATPFFRSLLQDDNMFVFEHTRSVSGNTIDALTSLATGCLPLTLEGQGRAFRRSIADEYKRAGYSTASFSTSPAQEANLKQSPWYMLLYYLSSSFDIVVDPVSEGHALINAEGSDDVLFLPKIKQWLSSVQNPFFTQFYTFNTHHPYRSRANSTNENEYYAALESVDCVLQSIFSMLRETGHADNTIVVGSGDHGEAATTYQYMRVSELLPSIVSTPSYMYIPDNLMKAERPLLRQNTQRVVSILDIFPTMQHILYGGNMADTAILREHNRAADITDDANYCITGYDLLSTDIPEHRIAVSWDLLSRRHDRQWLATVSTRDLGMYVRRGWNHANGLWRFVFHRNCTQVWEDACMLPMYRPQIEYFHGLFQNLNASLVSPAVQQSALFEALTQRLNSHMANIWKQDQAKTAKSGKNQQ